MKQQFSFYIILFLMAFVSLAFAERVGNQDSFWSQAAQSGMAEVMLSNLALQKSQNEEVKKLAQMIIEDHTKVNDELKSLAVSKNVALPMDVNVSQKVSLEKLNSLSGEAFDKEFVKTMVKDHETAVKLFQKQTDADVKNFASNTLPTLKLHWEAAKNLSNSMKNMK